MKLFNMGKGISAALALSLILTGCSSETSSEPEETREQEEVEITVWSVWDNEGSGALLYEAAEQFSEENPNINVTVQGQGGYDGVAEKLNNALVTKTTPTIVQIEESFIARYGPVAEDLTKYMDKEVTDNYIDGLLRSSYEDDILKAVPMNRSTPILYLNVDLLKEAGLPEEGPQTWEELKTFAAKLTNKEKGIIGFGGHWDTDAWFWESALYSYGGEVVNEDGSEVAFNNEKGYKIVELFQDMTKNGQMLSVYGAQGSQSSMIASQFLEGKVGMMLDSVAAMGGLYKNNENNIDIQAVYQPAGTEHSVVTGGANMIMMKDKTEEEKQAAGEFLEYLASDEFSTKFAIESGYFPTTKSSLETPEMQKIYNDNPSYKVAIDQLEYAHKRPWQKNWREMYQVIVEELEVSLVDLERDPKEVIDTAAKKSQKIIDENK